MKLLELTPPYEPTTHLIARIMTLARKEMAADEHRSARRSVRAAKKSSAESDNPGSCSSTPNTPDSEPMAAEHISGDRRQPYNRIVTQTIMSIVQNDTREMQHAILGGAAHPHMHAPGPHLPAHAPRSF